MINDHGQSFHLLSVRMHALTKSLEDPANDATSHET